MYSLDVNFLKNRTLEATPSSLPVYEKPIGQTDSMVPLFVGIVLLILFPATAGGYLWMTHQQKTQLEAEIQQMDETINRIRGENRNIDRIQEEIKKLQEENQALVSVFNQIKPWSAILQDIRDRIPQGIQINSIQQGQAASSNDGKDGGSSHIELNIKGVARSHNEVNDFLLTLKDSQFLESSNTILESTRAIESNNSTTKPGVQLPKLVEYNIKTELNNIPASELVEELARKGAVGLVTRIRTLEGKGALGQ